MRSTRLTLVLGLVALTTAGCSQGLLGSGSSSSDLAPDADITLGMAVPLSGSYAEAGPNMRNGAQMAIDEINAKGGVLGHKLKLDVQDDACDPKTAVSAANKLVSDGVAISVGGYCSGATLPTLPVFARADIPMIIPAANSDDLFKQHLSNVFMINGTGTQQAATAIGWMNKTGAHRVVLVHDNSSYAKNIADIVAGKLGTATTGPRSVATEIVTPGESDYSASVTDILRNHPDFVYWTGYDREGGLIIRQLRQAGYTGHIMVADGAVSPALIQGAGTADSEGVYATMTQTPQTVPGGATWSARYTSLFHSAPGPYSTQSYDAVRLAAQAITEAKGTNEAKVVSALEAINGFPLFSGPLKFTADHTLTNGGFVVLTVHNGAFVAAGPAA